MINYDKMPKVVCEMRDMKMLGMFKPVNVCLVLAI